MNLSLNVLIIFIVPLRQKSRLIMPPKTHAKPGKATKAIAEGDKKKRKGKKKPESYGFFIYKVLFTMFLMRWKSYVLCF